MLKNAVEYLKEPSVSNMLSKNVNGFKFFIGERCVMVY